MDSELIKKIEACQNPIKLAKMCEEAPEAQRLIASHIKAEAGLLRRLSVHGDKYVRYHVAQNPNTDEMTLKKLASDHEVIIREAARLNLILKR